MTRHLKSPKKTVGGILAEVDKTENTKMRKKKNTKIRKDKNRKLRAEYKNKGTKKYKNDKNSDNKRKLHKRQKYCLDLYVLPVETMSCEDASAIGNQRENCKVKLQFPL